jgi:hypothetical protein
MECILLFIFQLSFNILKTFEIKYTFKKEINKLMLNSLMINIISLLSLYFSINALSNGDLYMIISYLLGSLTGKWVSMKIFDIS